MSSSNFERLLGEEAELYWSDVLIGMLVARNERTLASRSSFQVLEPQVALQFLAASHGAPPAGSYIGRPSLPALSLHLAGVLSPERLLAALFESALPGVDVSFPLELCRLALEREFSLERAVSYGFAWLSFRAELPGRFWDRELEEMYASLLRGALSPQESFGVPRVWSWGTFLRNLRRVDPASRELLVALLLAGSEVSVVFSQVEAALEAGLSPGEREVFVRLAPGHSGSFRKLAEALRCLG